MYLRKRIPGRESSQCEGPVLLCLGLGVPRRLGHLEGREGWERRAEREGSGRAPDGMVLCEQMRGFSFYSESRSHGRALRSMGHGLTY